MAKGLDQYLYGRVRQRRQRTANERAVAFSLNQTGQYVNTIVNKHLPITSHSLHSFKTDDIDAQTGHDGRTGRPQKQTRLEPYLVSLSRVLLDEPCPLAPPSNFREGSNAP